MKAKNKAAKTAATTALTAADAIKGEQGKVIDTTKNKIKTCESKVKEADGNLKTLYAQKVEINNQLAKATPKQLAAGTLATSLKTLEADITKNKAVIEEMAVCITTLVTTQTTAREKIVEVKEAANEAQLISKQTQQIEELVQAQVNQSQQIEKDIEDDLAKDWNVTSTKVKVIVKEQTSIKQQKKESKKKVLDLTKKVETSKKAVKEL